MKLERIGAQHPLFDASFSLYESSFPPNERRTRADHLLALQDTDFLPLGAVEDDRLLADVGRAELVILDEFGYVPLDVEGARLLFQVMSSCYEKRSVIVTTNIEFGK